jgi:hypothetical protein
LLYPLNVVTAIVVVVYYFSPVPEESPAAMKSEEEYEVKSEEYDPSEIHKEESKIIREQ